MQSLALGNSLVEGLALGGGDLDLESTGLAGTVGTLEGFRMENVKVKVRVNLQRMYRHPRRYHREPRPGWRAERRQSCIQAAHKRNPSKGQYLFKKRGCGWMKLTW